MHSTASSSSSVDAWTDQWSVDVLLGPSGPPHRVVFLAAAAISNKSGIVIQLPSFLAGIYKPINDSLVVVVVEVDDPVDDEEENAGQERRAASSHCHPEGPAEERVVVGDDGCRAVVAGRIESISLRNIVRKGKGIKSNKLVLQGMLWY